MRIGIVTSLRQANSAYRALPLLELARLGHEVGVANGENMPSFEELSTCDVIHIYRYQEPGIQRLARSLREAGIAITWDNDDDLTTSPAGLDESKVKGALRSQRFQSRMTAMVRVPHVVTTTNETLAEHYRSWGAEHVRVIENFLPKNYGLTTAPEPHEGITIGWTAMGEHRYDFAALGMREALTRLLDAHPQLTFTSIGVEFGLSHERYRAQSFVEYADLASQIARFDIGIAPIADIPFNRARSNVKVKEYAGAGIPWLASPIGPYAGLGEKQGGQLVPDDRWEQELDRLIRDPKRRRKLAKRGRKWAYTQTAESNVRLWESALEEALSRARG